MSSSRSARLNRDYVSYNQVGLLSENIHRLLTEKECSIFDRGLADYHRRRNVKSLVECLSLVLNTGQKRKLLIPIRDSYVKPSDLSKFNQLVQAHGLATSHRQKVKAEEKDHTDSIRKLEIKRDADGQWGFSIRGGSEHGIGIFVSWIEPGSHAEKCGLQVGDQILKANDTNLERINHYDAVMLMKGAKKLRLFVLSHGRIPGSRMAHKVYHWVDSEGRPASPPPDPFEMQDSSGVMNEADERKVTVIIDKDQELGISIRGGIEHGLGIYISSVEEDSVAESYGLKVGDQILDVNGVSFLGIVHADAANALRAQSCMVMKIKDVGKLPHSRVTAYSQTKWYPTHKDGEESVKMSPTAIFRPGVGSQMMLGQQQDNLLKGHGLLKDVAQSVLSEQELAMFMYHLKQYQQYDLPINEMIPPILNLLDTPEKLQLLTELRGLIKPQDIERYNELTVHKEIMAKKHNTSHQRNETSPGGRDLFPQKMSPPRSAAHQFNIPPPPTGNGEESFEGSWNNSTQRVDTSLLEERVRSETEIRLKNEFLEKEKKIIEEQQRLLEEERSQKEALLRQEKEMMEEAMKQREDHIKVEIESKIRSEIEREATKELAEKERAMQEEREKWMQEEQDKEDQIQLMQEKMKEEIEEKIWKEAEDRIREEYEQKRQQEREASLQRKSKVSEKAAAWDVEGRIRRDLDNRIRREYEDKLKFELNKLKQQHESERQQREEALEQRKQEEVVSRLEAEEQTRIEVEEKIRRETEAKVRAEYEARLQQESEERARLAEEVKVRKEAEERLQRDQRLLEQEREKEKREAERKQREEREKREREIAALEEEKEALKQQMNKEMEDEAQEDESTDGFELSGEDHAATGGSDQYALEQQRRMKQYQEQEEEKQRQQEAAALEEEKKRQENERLRKKELERKREENLRRKEEERKKREEEKRQREQATDQNGDHNAVEGERREDKVNSQKVKVNFGEDESGSLKKKRIKKAKADSIENERRRAEEKLERRLRRAQEKKKNEPKSYAGYTDLEGDILHISVTKVVKKLGIAIDGGANTKQKAVIIREISPEGCAAQTGMGMSVNQQILEVNGQSLFGLKHREVVMAIKTGFDGPLNKVIEFVVLDTPTK